MNISYLKSYSLIFYCSKKGLVFDAFLKKNSIWSLIFYIIIYTYAFFLSSGTFFERLSEFKATDRITSSFLQGLKVQLFVIDFNICSVDSEQSI